MIPELPLVTAPPRWLMEATLNGLPEAPPLSDILQDSLFYPASRFDGSPVKLLAGNVVSFVYADYGVGHDDLLRELNGEGQGLRFPGYTMIAGRDVKPEDIGPFRMVHPPHSHPRHVWPNNAFAHWSIWKRDENRDHTHVAELFSFLYLGWEALTAFKTIYLHKFAPKILAIINPGDGFGGTWTPLRSDCPNCGIFRRAVMGSTRDETQVILPEYLLCARRARLPQRPCWDDYDQVCVREFPEDGLALWKINADAIKRLPPLPE